MGEQGWLVRSDGSKLGELEVKGNGTYLLRHAGEAFREVLRPTEGIITDDVAFRAESCGFTS